MTPQSFSQKAQELADKARDLADELQAHGSEAFRLATGEAAGTMEAYLATTRQAFPRAIETP